MTERLGCGAWDRDALAEMTTEELSTLLRMDLEAPAGHEADPEMLLCVMEELACRRKPEENRKTPQEAWASFQQNYLSEEEMLEPSANRRRISLRRVVAIAAVVAILVCIPLISLAVDWEACFDGLATWTKDTFFFDRSGETEPTQLSVEAGDYHSLEKILEATGRECDFLPTWIPDGYILEEIIVDESPMINTYICVYRCGEKRVEISAVCEGNTNPMVWEKSEETVEIYETADNRYYLFYNLDQLNAAWIYDDFECYICGELSVEEVKLMIDSIGKEQTNVN